MQTIIPDLAPTLQLPPISDTVTIDGTTQPGYTDSPLIEITATDLTFNQVFWGLTVEAGAPGTTIRGLVVNGYFDTNKEIGAIRSYADDVLIEDNYLGLTPDGNSVHANDMDILIDGAASTVVRNNVVSGAAYALMLRNAVDTEIVSNRFGTNAAGTASLPVNAFGSAGSMSTTLSTGTIIGREGEGNLIAVSLGIGSAIVEQNLMGTDVTGTVGIALQSVQAGDGGLIRNNVMVGRIYISGDTEVRENYIGVRADGSSVLSPNGPDVSFGVELGANGDGATAHVVDNVIGGLDVGVRFRAGVSGAVIQRNFIGTDATGTVPLPNDFGIVVESNDAVIGGPLPGDGNTIAFNNLDGVFVRSPSGSAAGVRIRSNSIYSNGGRAIRHLRNYGNPPPAIESVSPLSGTACPGCVIDIYSGSNGEAVVPEGSVTTNGLGFWTWGGTAQGPCVSVTATKAGAWTSEFETRALSGSPFNNDADFLELTPLPYDDFTQPMSDVATDECDDDDDNDGLSDVGELSLPGPACPSATAPTDPLDADSDGDLRIDTAECIWASDPSDIGSIPPSDTGGDGDGVPYLYDADDSTNVSDTDGITDHLEFLYYGTYGAVTDSDGDGCSDPREMASFNADRKVSAIDLSQIAQHFNAEVYALPAPAYIVNFDINKDRKISSIDLSQVANRFGLCP